MAKRAKPASEIQSLLEEKRRLEKWLERLSMSADQTADHVRSKVGSDYEKRLETVIEKLQGFKDQVAQTLEEQQEALERLEEEERAASEKLSEAELRHAVGEYDEGKFTKLRTDLLESLVKVREAVKATTEEIASLEEVIALVEAPEEEVAEPAVDMVELGGTMVDLDEPSQEEHIVDVGSGSTGQTPARSSSQTDAFGDDEMAFLKSVTEDESQGPSVAGASGKLKGISDKDMESAQRRARDSAAIGADGVESINRHQDRPKKGEAKTLTCKECGTKNLPTEWYCEQCGAELSAV